MNDLLEFLTSKEIMVVYIVAGVACILCFVIYLVDKNYYKRKRKQNTRELNRLVEDINIKLEEEQKERVKEVFVESISQEVKVVEKPVLEEVEELSIEAPFVVESDSAQVLEKPVIEKLEVVSDNISNDSIDKVEDIVLEAMTEDEVVEELTYTDIEPNRQQAQAELIKLTEELEKAEQETKNIDLTAYEEEQEENAIISLEELVKKSKEMYAANEISQYADEGNEPISLADLELRKQESVQEVVKEEPVIIEMIPDAVEEKVVEVHQERMVLDDFNNIKLEERPVEVKPAYQSTKKFQSSPVISPIYGIERKETSTDIELENTANYEKLDEEIKKTNEFLMTLRELQKHLD